MCDQLLQSCLTLCDPMDSCPPGSSVPGTLQAKVLEWDAMHFSRGSSQCRDWTHVSCIIGRFFTAELPGSPSIVIKATINIFPRDFLILDEPLYPAAKPRVFPLLWWMSVLCLVSQSFLILWDHMFCSSPGSTVHGDSPSKNAGVGCHALLQGIFPTQGSSPDLPLCRRIPHQLNYQGSPT